MIGPITQIHNIAFDPDSQPPELFVKHETAAEKMKLYIRGVFVTDDLKDMMPSDHNSVKSVSESDNPPLQIQGGPGKTARGPHRRRGF